MAARTIGRTVVRMHKRAVPVADLQFGMYVAELDRPWVETPFAFQGFMLQTERQLQALRKFCRHVSVDVAVSGAGHYRQACVAASLIRRTFEMHGNAGYTAHSELAHDRSSWRALFANR